MQFLMGLDDSYMQIRSSILSREVLPDVRSAYAAISSEESHRVVGGSIAGSSQRNQDSAFVSNVPYSQNIQRNNQNNSNGPSRPNNLNNNRQGGGLTMVCENCGFNGHNIDRCFKIIRYPADFGKKKTGQNFKKQNVSNNNYVGKSSSSGLSNGLTLYDVMVIPEYCVTLISVHKLAKENKVIVAFDESRCYFLNHDLNLKNVLRIGDQCEGLYYYSNQEPVLNVLEDSLQINKKDNTVYYLWGPYRVTSSEGFRYFLTVVDDYTRAVWVYLIKSKDEDSEVEKNDSVDVFQDVNHINFFDIEYLKIPNDDERVANSLNKGKSDSNNSSVSGSNINTADFPVNSGNDADSSDELVATHNEGVTTLEENVFSEEMDALLRNDTWEIIDLPGGRKAIGSKWIYKIKFRSSGEIDRCLLNIAVNNAFLYCDLEEVVYMKPPEGYFSSDNKVYRLKKSLYGLKQAPRQCNAKLTSTLIENGFSQSKPDYSLYTKSDKGVFLALLVYADDIIITGNSVSEIEKFKVYLKSKFMIKDLEKLKYFIGIEVVDTDK
ncbi:ribonuclease H-like domain-containing protein, partial [Tanacetum coccineum]